MSPTAVRLATGEDSWGRAVPALLCAFGIGIAVVYWPGISGPATSPRWAFACVLPAVLFFAPRIKITPAHLIGAAYVAWALASYCWSWTIYDTVGSGWKLVLLACAFCLGSLADDLRPLYRGAALGIGLSSAIAVAQWFGIQPLPDVSGLVGLFVNPILMAEAAALIGVALLAERMWSWLPLIAPALLLPMERGPLLAFAVGSVAAIWRWSRTAAIGVMALAVIAGVAITAANHGRLNTADERLTIWRTSIGATTLIGRGLGSYREAAPQPIVGTQFEHAHNEFIEAAFETGWVGAALLAAFFAIALFAGFSTETIVLLALLTEATFAFPFHEPFTGIVGLLSAGGCVRGLRSARSAFAYRRARLRFRVAQFQEFLAVHGSIRRRGRSISVRSQVS